MVQAEPTFTEDHVMVGGYKTVAKYYHSDKKALVYISLKMRLYE